MRTVAAALLIGSVLVGCATPRPTPSVAPPPATPSPAVASPAPTAAVVARPSPSPLPYEIDCGPVPPSTCEAEARRAVDEATKRYPGTKAASVELDDTKGSFTVVLDNGLAVASIVD